MSMLPKSLDHTSQPLGLPGSYCTSGLGAVVAVLELLIFYLGADWAERQLQNY